MHVVQERNVLEDNKNAGLPKPWISDWTLQQGCIHNIDRTRDPSCKELLDAALNLQLKDQVRLSLAHRFIPSRPGNTELFSAFE